MGKSNRRRGRHADVRVPTRGQLRSELIATLTEQEAGDDVVEYARLLFGSGMDAREAYRAALYAQRFGMAALKPEDPAMCVHFDEPSCVNWNCLNPEHQVVVFAHGHHHG
jgi:hypothetical protein